MFLYPIATILIIIANLTVTYKGLTNFGFFNKYKFNIQKIVVENNTSDCYPPAFKC